MLDVVPAARHDQASAELAEIRARGEPLHRLLRRLAADAAPDEDPERAYATLRSKARALLHATSRLPAEATDAQPVERIAGWLCLECGRFEAPQPCLGVCIWRRREVVCAAAHDALMEELIAERARLKRLGGLLGRLAWVTPHRGAWDRTRRALQNEAQGLLHELQPKRAYPLA
jgi:hypothetical protein